MTYRTPPPDRSLLKRLYSYDPVRGVFSHKRNGRLCKIGCVAGYQRKDGYVVIRVNSTTYQAHRLAWYYIHNTWPHEIDHVDGCRSNNRLGNLRPATRTQNNGNSNGWGSRKKSGLPRGVYHNKIGKPFQALISMNYNLICLGTFDTVEAAQAAYSKAARKHFGAFAK